MKFHNAFFLLIFWPAQTFAQSITVSVSAGKLEAENTVAVLIHDFEGKIIQYEMIKGKDRRDGFEMEVELGSYSEDDIGLTLLGHFGRGKTKTSFINETYCGLYNGFQLNYLPVKSFPYSASSNVKFNIYDIKHFGRIVKTWGGQSIQLVETIDSVSFFNYLLEDDQPIFIAFSSTNYEFPQYFFRPNESLFGINPDYFSDQTGFSDCRNIGQIRYAEGLHCSNMSLSAYSDYAESSIRFNRGKTQNGLLEFPLPEELQFSSYQFTGHFESEEQNFQYYYSGDTLPAKIEPLSVDFSMENTTRSKIELDVDASFRYAIGYVQFQTGKFYDDGSAISPQWKILAPIDKKFAFTLPEIPAEVAEEYPVFTATNSAIATDATVIKGETGIRDAWRKTPQIIEDVYWRMSYQVKSVWDIIEWEISKPEE